MAKKDYFCQVIYCKVMKNLFYEKLKTIRKEKGLLIKDIANSLNIDQSLISKFEKGTRKPTKTQVIKIAELLNIKEEELLIPWMSDNILKEIGYDTIALKSIQMVEEQIVYYISYQSTNFSATLKSLLNKINVAQSDLINLRHLDSYKIAEALAIEYTYESNRIEGNTLTLQETHMVVNDGLTINGKSMREHLEAINHYEAIEFIKDLVKKNASITESVLLQIHNLVLRGIEPQHAGKYRNIQVMIGGSSHIPPAPYLVKKEMEDYFIWYNENKNRLHPVILAAEMHEKLVSIHPFIDGNGRTSRLLMNLILLQNGYVIANIKGDKTNRMAYYEALENVRKNNSKEEFILLVAQFELDALKHYLKILT